MAQHVRDYSALPRDAVSAWSIRLRNWLIQQLDALAGAQGISRQALVELLLLEALQARRAARGRQR